jgi:predicted dehydrogenase
MDRRHFLMTSAAAAAASQTAIASPNDTIRVATIGLNGRGKDHIKEITGLATQCNVELAAVCDIDQQVLEKGAKQVEAASGKAPKTYTDYRKLLEDKSIDARSRI